MMPNDPMPFPAGVGEDQREEANKFDVALMMRIQTGDLEAFEDLVEIHQRSVIGIVAKMLGNASDAEDIAQQVFLRVWKSSGRYEPRARFTTWLFTIARNLVFNELRRRQRKSTVSMQEHEESTFHEIVDSKRLSPEEEVLHSELERVIDLAIDELPEKQRLAVILRRFEEMPYEEIGKVLEMSVPAVKSLLFRARTQLKHALSQYLDKED